MELLEKNKQITSLVETITILTQCKYIMCGEQMLKIAVTVSGTV
jgi:hypothetical protein